MGSQLLENDKYKIKVSSGDASSVTIEIEIKDEQLSEAEFRNFKATIQKLLYAFDRIESVSGRFGSAPRTNNKKKS